MEDVLRDVGVLDEGSNRQFLIDCKETKEIMIGKEGMDGLYAAIYSSAT